MCCVIPADLRRFIGRSCVYNAWRRDEGGGAIDAPTPNALMYGVFECLVILKALTVLKAKHMLNIRKLHVLSFWLCCLMLTLFMNSPRVKYLLSLYILLLYRKLFLFVVVVLNVCIHAYSTRPF